MSDNGRRAMLIERIGFVTESIGIKYVFIIVAGERHCLGISDTSV